ncbi:MAG: hypothetical protein ACUVX1_15920 [Chloroflexota bacterium]
MDILDQRESWSVEDAWRIIQVYWRRMEAEQTLRCLTRELDLRSFRVRSIDAIRKLFSLAVTTLAFLVELFKTEPALVELIGHFGRWLGLKGEKVTLCKLRWGFRRLLQGSPSQPPDPMDKLQIPLG